MVVGVIHPMVSVIDVEETSALPEPVKRARGRPLGSKGKPTRKIQALTVPEFSFFRASLQGVAFHKAAARFLPEHALMNAEQSDSYTKFLFETIVSTGRKHLEGLDKNSPEFHALTSAIDGLSDYWLAKKNPEPIQAPSTGRANFSWSLEDFMDEEGITEDFYSESELLEIYEQAFNEKKAKFDSESPATPNVQVTSPAPKVHVDKAISSLGLLQSQLVVSPRPDDALSGWISSNMADKFKPLGVLTLKQLAVWVNRTGAAWHKEVSAVGRKKAASITQWLYSYEEYTGVAIERRIVESALLYLGQDLPDSISSPADGNQTLCPLQDVQWPKALNGANGIFRSSDENTYQASDDQQAVEAWLNSLKTSNKNTQLAYSRAVERLVLWALFVKGVAVSSLTSADLADFFDFLRDPPASWVQKSPAVKGSALWRPMRGGLSDKSLELNVQAVKQMFSSWFNANYLKANAAKGAGYKKRKAASMDVMRSFTVQDLAYIKRSLDAMPPGPSQNRQKALMMLLLTTGMRAREFINQKWKFVSQARFGMNSSNDYVISLIGKGDKERILPIRADVYQALKTHLEDRKELTKTEKLSSFSHFKDSDWPLIGIIDETKAQQSDGADSDYSYDCARKGNIDGTISYERFKNIVTTFFKQCAVLCDSEDQDSSRLRQATPHWMRHTFAHVVLEATDKDLVVVQSLLGHSDLSTTGLYVKADIEKRVESVKNIPDFL